VPAWGVVVVDVVGDGGAWHTVDHRRPRRRLPVRVGSGDVRDDVQGVDQKLQKGSLAEVTGEEGLLATL